MYTLGINAAFHDPAACLVRDGVIVAAAEEERFTGIKHGKRPVPFSAYELPYNAIDYCLQEAGIRLTDVHHVAYSYNPCLRQPPERWEGAFTLPYRPSDHPVRQGWESPWDPLFLSYIINAPRLLRDGYPHHLAKRLSGVGPGEPYRWHFIDHHTAHAASAFLVSPFDRAAVMTIDGRGEKATTGYAAGSHDGLRIIREVTMPHSLGLLYERITRHLGFLHSSDEYKVMALASSGRPAFSRVFRDMVVPGRDGSYTVRDTDLTGVLGPARDSGEPITRRHLDIARSLQETLEETVLSLAEWLHGETGEEDLCLAGGVALNCVLNSHIRDRGPFRRVWVQPAAGDAGTALGAAVWTDAAARGEWRGTAPMEHTCLGPGYSEREIESALKRAGVGYTRPPGLPDAVASLLADNRIAGWFEGRMEFGPRALGARSIVASPADPRMQSRLNDLKGREDFRPVAPAVLEEDASDWFVIREPSPFMLFVHRVRRDREPLVPAIRHCDGTARVQTVGKRDAPLFHGLLSAFKRRTGLPIVINTSFNTLGRPIVRTPADALETFWSSPLDALAIGPFLIRKTGG